MAYVTIPNIPPAYNGNVTTGRLTWLTLLLVLAGGVVPWVLMASGAWGQLPMSLPGVLPSYNLPLREQAAQAIAGLVIKPTYMLVCALIIVALTGQPAADIRLLRWGLAAFLMGEIFCSINFYLFRHTSLLSEYLHGYGMAVAFAFTALAFLEALDHRVLKLSQSPGACTAVKLCGRCTRHESAGCRARTVALFLLPMAAALAIVPLQTRLAPQAYEVGILGFPYSYARLPFYLVYEGRVLPLIALLAWAVAIAVFLRRSEPPMPIAARVAACMGIGALGFSFFRVTLNALFAGSLVWFEFWEEATEFLWIAATLFVLWQFRLTALSATPLLRAAGMQPREAAP